LKWIYEEYEGSSFENLSLISFSTECNFDGGNAVVPGGYFQLVKMLAEGLSINLETVVESIENFIQEPILIRTNKGNLNVRKLLYQFHCLV
jgi:hypothetical protein